MPAEQVQIREMGQYNSTIVHLDRRMEFAGCESRLGHG